MIGFILALALQADSPSPTPSVTPSPTSRTAPTAKPLPQPTPPYLIGPKGWLRIAYPPHRSAANFPRVAGWTHFGDRGEEDLIVTKIYSSGRTAQGVARADTVLDIGQVGYPTLVSSKPHPLCGGTVPGWEAIVRSGTGLGSHTTDMIYAVDSLIGYTVRYTRESTYPPDPQAVAALRSFCPTRARILAAAITPAAIVVPHSWVQQDVSYMFHVPAGMATMYSIPYDDQMIMVFREDTPDGVSADVDADIAYGIASLATGRHKILSKQGIQLCDGDGWIVKVLRPMPRRDVVDTVVFHFGAPKTYLAVYRRAASSRELTPAIKAIKSLCPPK